MAQRLSTLCEVNWVDGICGSGQIGTVKTRGVENAGVDISAQCGKGGQCGSGQIGTVCQGYIRGSLRLIRQTSQQSSNALAAGSDVTAASCGGV